MTGRPQLVGRESELANLAALLDGCRSASGGLLWISGEAGVGKTRLVNESLARWPHRVLRGAAILGGPAFGPLVEAVRSDPGPHSRDSSVALDAEIARRVAEQITDLADLTPTVLVLEDLHWADAATLDLLGRLAATVEDRRLLVVATYRSDQLPRTHPLRRLRSELRRRGQLRDLPLNPLEKSQTAQLLEGLLGGPASESLGAAVHERSDGLPFFVEELTATLAGTGTLQRSENGWEFAEPMTMSAPESIVDAVLARTADLRDRHPEAVEIAAVCGVQVHLPTLAALTSDADVDAVLGSGLLVEATPPDPGWVLPGAEVGVFRHALVQEALHSAIPWARRRTRHAEVARLLAKHGHAGETVAEHWIAAHEYDKARPLLLDAAKRSCTVHAYTDAARLTRRALEIWPPRHDPQARLDVLEELAGCAELCQELSSAADAWASVAEAREATGDLPAAAAAHARLASVRELVGNTTGVVLAREAAVAAYDAAEAVAEATEQRLLLAEHHWSAGRATTALAHAVAATAGASTTGSTDLRARALAVQGGIRATIGDTDGGVAMAREGLALALDAQSYDAAGDSYYQLASALLYASQYAAAADAYAAASDLCRTHGVNDLATACTACLAVARRMMGDWKAALTIAADIHHDESAPLPARMVAAEELGLVSALRGNLRQARGPLRRAALFGRDAEVYGIEVGAEWGLALVAELEDDTATALGRISGILSRSTEKEEWHFALPALRWASSFLAERDETDELSRCHQVLAAAATRDSSPKVLSTLAHAGAELARAQGDATSACEQFSRSLDLLHGIPAPYEAALTRLRHGAALAADCDRVTAADSTAEAYRTAKALRAKPLARACSDQLAAIGGSVDRGLGRTAMRSREPAGVTRREKEVLGLLADGLTNRQIAAELYLSPRTVDMHVRNLFTKLDVGGRAAAVQRAITLGVLPR